MHCLLMEVLNLPRLRKMHSTAGDLLEVLRSCEKTWFELLKQGERLYIRTVQRV